MNEINILLPFLTGLFGWLLSEMGRRRKELSTDRRAIAKALADLLELRHQTIGFKAYLDEFVERFDIPKEVLPIVLAYFDNLLPNTEALQKRYNEAVDVVASADPLLGFRLRSKDELTPYLRTLRQLTSQDANASELFGRLEAQLLEVIKSPMDEVILDLAKTHGWRTWWRVRKHVRRPVFDKKDFEEIFSKFDPIMSAASQQMTNAPRSGA